MAGQQGILRGGRELPFDHSSPAGQGTGTRSATLTPPCGERQGQGTILFVHSEEGILGVGRQMLKHRGFCILTVADGSKALKTLRTHRDEGIDRALARNGP